MSELMSMTAEKKYGAGPQRQSKLPWSETALTHDQQLELLGNIALQISVNLVIKKKLRYDKEKSKKENELAASFEDPFGSEVGLLQSKAPQMKIPGDKTWDRPEQLLTEFWRYHTEDDIRNAFRTINKLAAEYQRSFGELPVFDAAVNTQPPPQAKPAGAKPQVKTKTAPPKQEQPKELKLGQLSAIHESNEDPGKINPGTNDKGGRSYGTYQLASIPGSIDEFLDYLKDNKTIYYYQLNEALTADENKKIEDEKKKIADEKKKIANSENESPDGENKSSDSENKNPDTEKKSPDTEKKTADSKKQSLIRGKNCGENFDKAWKSIAKKDRDGFFLLQHNFILNRRYGPVMKALAEKGFNMSGRSLALKNAIWSTAVQHGANGATDLILNNILKKLSFSPNDESLINLLYDERTRVDPARQKRFTEEREESAVQLRLQEKKAETLAAGELDELMDMTNSQQEQKPLY